MAAPKNATESLQILSAANLEFLQPRLLSFFPTVDICVQWNAFERTSD